MNQQIKCEGCNKKIATGELPAKIMIKCPHCGSLNDLSKPNPGDKAKPFTERLNLEKKA